MNFKCECQGVEIQSYKNQIWVHAPAHMPKANGYCIDLCIVQEIMQLWMLGITTTGCCCGHQKVEPYIGVSDEDCETMQELGYQEQKKNQYFPIGAVHNLTIMARTNQTNPLGHDKK